MNEIFNHPWIKGPILNQSELEQDLGNRMLIVEEILLKENENKLLKEKVENNISQSNKDLPWNTNENSIFTVEELNNIKIKIEEINEKLKINLSS